MLTYRVRCFKDGQWDGNDLVEVKAGTPEHAASVVCGGPVRGGLGTLQELRAHVWQLDDTKPEPLTMPEYLFYAPLAPK